MALVYTTSSEQHKSRWSWSLPLHRFQTSHIHCLDGPGRHHFIGTVLRAVAFMTTTRLMDVYA